MNQAWICPVLLLLAGCASHASILTILPPEDGGEVGGVAQISPDGGELLYDQVRQSTNLTSKSGSKSISDGKIEKLLHEINTSMPPRPRIFLLIFNRDQAAIENSRIMEEIRTELSIRPGAEIEIVGFTDSVGDEDMNDNISSARAMSVASELRGYGFSVNDEDVIFRGEGESRKKNGDNVADESFRRVEVIVR